MEGHLIQEDAKILPAASHIVIVGKLGPEAGAIMLGASHVLPCRESAAIQKSLQLGLDRWA